MDFVDEVTIRVAAGNGGDGIVAFRREKFVPRGGPNGGNGGYGASIVLEADQSLSTLVEFRYSSQYVGKDGGRGGPNNRSGQHQDPLVICVPVGTAVFNNDSGRAVADLAYHGQTVVVARGGRGGRGNASFATSTNQAPKHAEKGEPGESAVLRLDLKLLADVGVIGFPSSGKSTLIASVSNARPKIADYPFTTLVPNLGVVRVGPTESFVMADVPGLIAGAHEGAGLGHRFLRHIERTRVLIHLVDCSPETGLDPVDEYGIIRRELAAYSTAVASLPEIIALNKVDIPEAREAAQRALDELPLRYPEIGENGRPIRIVSTATGQNVQKLVWDAARILRESPREPVATPEEVVHITGPEAPWTISRGPSGEFVVRGRQPERLVAMTDLENQESLRRLHSRLGALGILKELRQMGIDDQDTVRVGGFEFDWIDEDKPDSEWAEKAGGER